MDVAEAGCFGWSGPTAVVQVTNCGIVTEHAHCSVSRAKSAFSSPCDIVSVSCHGYNITVTIAIARLRGRAVVRVYTSKKIMTFRIGNYGRVVCCSLAHVLHRLLWWRFLLQLRWLWHGRSTRSARAGRGVCSRSTVPKPRTSRPSWRSATAPQVALRPARSAAHGRLHMLIPAVAGFCQGHSSTPYFVIMTDAAA